MFDFVDPAWAGRRALSLGWQARLDEGGQGRTQHHVSGNIERHSLSRGGVLPRPHQECVLMPHHAHSIDRWDDATGSNLYEHLAGVHLFGGDGCVGGFRCAS
jgi:hypothetical protein